MVNAFIALPIGEQRLGYKHDGKRVRDAQEEFRVFVATKPCVKTGGLVKNIFSHHHRGGEWPHGLVEDNLGKRVSSFFPLPGMSSRVDGAHIGPEQADSRKLQNIVSKGLKLVGVPQIIGVEERDPVASR